MASFVKTNVIEVNKYLDETQTVPCGFSVSPVRVGGRNNRRQEVLLVELDASKQRKILMSTKRSIRSSSASLLFMIPILVMMVQSDGFSITRTRVQNGQQKSNMVLDSTSAAITNNNENPNNLRQKHWNQDIANATDITGSQEVVTVITSKIPFKDRQAMYDQMRMQAACSTKSSSRSPSIWSFEALFPSPVWDEETIHKDLFEVSDLENQILSSRQTTDEQENGRGDTEHQHDLSPNTTTTVLAKKRKHTVSVLSDDNSSAAGDALIRSDVEKTRNVNTTTALKQDFELSRMVKDRVYGMRSSSSSPIAHYDSSLVDSSRAVQFTQDGRRIGRALKVNIDLLTYAAKRAFRKHNVSEAEKLYLRAMGMDPHDGRPYLGLSRCAQQRQDLASARKYLKMGIRKAIYNPAGSANPFLLQALGTLEEKSGHLAEAEKLYVAAVNAEPSHAAAWVSLAQLRTEKLRQSVNAGRVCYENAERELALAGQPPSSYVYAAWAALEYRKAGNVKLARDLFQKAIAVDPKSSAAYLQLGVMEADGKNWDKAKECFEAVLKFDNRNSRVLQAFAIMESKRPDGDSRTAIGLFERALKVNSRDAGVFQAYGLYVASLGDIDAAKNLLRRGTVANRKHAPVWQAWGVLESRHGSVETARDIFQQGIWACAQSSGGQSGGRHCARLWQAWGLLEEREGDYAAARRCFSRAMDADSRNIATITARTLMEERLGNLCDARAIFERSLKQFTSPASDDYMAVWRAYELMEIRAGNTKAAQAVYQRYTRASFAEAPDDQFPTKSKRKDQSTLSTTTSEVEIVEWNKKSPFKKISSAMESEVWMNNGAVEGKIPVAQMRKFAKNSSRNS